MFGEILFRLLEGGEFVMLVTSEPSCLRLAVVPGGAE